MDEFSVAMKRELSKAEIKEGVADDPIEVEIKDQGNGTYRCTYTLPKGGTYEVSVAFAGTFNGLAGPCRGSPYTVKALESKDLAARNLEAAQEAQALCGKELDRLEKALKVAEAIAAADVTDSKAQDAVMGAQIAVEAQQEEKAAKDAAAKVSEANMTKCVENNVNNLDGPLIYQALSKSIKETKKFSEFQTAELIKTNPDDKLDALVLVKRALSAVADATTPTELLIATNRTALKYFKKQRMDKAKTKETDKLLKDLELSNELWHKAKKEVPGTQRRITASNQGWTEKVEASIGEYTEKVKSKVFEYKKRSLWTYDTGVEEAKKDMFKAENWLSELQLELEQNAELTKLFEYPQLINEAKNTMTDMKQWLDDMERLWNVADTAQKFLTESKSIKWSEMNVEELEDGSKRIMKSVKALSKDVRWSNAFIALDKVAKDFLNTVPLISSLGNKAMRERHWKLIMQVTHKDFTSPLTNRDMLLQSILDLNLADFAGDVDEICDQSQKEDKMEKSLKVLNERYAVLEWAMDPYKRDESVPLLKMDGDQFEQLEADQLAVGGMLANRYVAQFQTECDAWRASLNNIADGFGLFSEIQRTWSYLEPLFIGSEEVKKELPEDAVRFAGTDNTFKDTLKSTYKILNIRKSSDEPGLIKTLETCLEQLNVCKKALKDFLEGRQRQFPRFFFIAEADLLDILSNGSEPRKIMNHTPKVYLCAKTFLLSKEDTPSGRPTATHFVAGVGKETTALEPPIPLEGKVEQYMDILITTIKETLFEHLKRSLTKYASMDRIEWLMHRLDGSCSPLTTSNPPRNDKIDPSDCAQIVLLVLAVYYVEEVEEAFRGLEAGQPNSMREYNEKQIKQIKGLISMAIKVDTKMDMMRIMVCITMDAHNRDIVRNKLVLFNIQEVDCSSKHQKSSPHFGC